MRLPSSGLHSNGISLARKVLLDAFDVNDKPIELSGNTVGDEFLTPTKIYVKDILNLINNEVDLHGVAHVTGGGLPSKLGSIVPKHLTAKLNKANWEIPAVFKLIQKLEKIELSEMFNAFNMGIGMVVVVDEKDVHQVKGLISDVVVIGKVFDREGQVVID